MKTITKHYINGAFVESHGCEVLDIISPTTDQKIGSVTLADLEDTRKAIAAARQAFVTFSRTTKEERTKLLRRLHESLFARIDDLTNMMIEEYGGTAQFSSFVVQGGVSAFLSAEKALNELELTRSWGGTTITYEPVGVAGLISPWNANALFVSLKLASAIAGGCTVVMKPSELSAMQTHIWLGAR
jgi:aldehyde dehydrogenase (NAD+)